MAKFSANCSSFQTVKVTPSTFLSAPNQRRFMIAASISAPAVRGVRRAGLFPTQAKWRGRELDPPKLLAAMQVCECGVSVCKIVAHGTLTMLGLQ